MTMHSNSIAAYQQERDAGNLSKREKLILDCLRTVEIPCHRLGGLTDREIMRFLRFTDANSVRPRISGLLERGILEECGAVKDPDTKMTVRLVRIKRPAENLELFQ